MSEQRTPAITNADQRDNRSSTELSGLRITDTLPRPGLSELLDSWAFTSVFRSADASTFPRSVFAKHILSGSNKVTLALCTDVKMSFKVEIRLFQNDGDGTRRT